MKELTRGHWIETKNLNEALILQNQIQTEMAKNIIELCDKKIAEFPEPEPKIPLGV